MQTPSSSSDIYVSPACRLEECRICVWRNFVLPKETDDDIVDKCHTPLALLQLSSRSEANKFAMHEELPSLWKEICNTFKLQRGSPFLPPQAASPMNAPRLATSGCQPLRSWFRFPMRNMRPMSLRLSAHFQAQTDHVDDYEGRRVQRDAEGKFTVYHFTKLMNLVQPHEQSVGSGGILKDGGMRYGCMHGDGIGVYCWASRPYELFSEGDGWVMLELRCHGSLTRVKGRTRGKYVIKSDQTSQSEGAHCTDCEVVAMLHLYESLPEFMKF